MLDHPIIDVGFGLILFYVLLSLVVSSIQEWIAAVFGLRAATLRSGLENLINDAAVVRNLMTHPLIKGLSKRRKKGGKKKAQNDGDEGTNAEEEDDAQAPSYIDTATLSAVLVKQLDTKGTLDGVSDSAALKKAVTDVGGKLEALLGPLLAVNDENVDDARRRLAAWFDEGMNRVGGWYKRKTELYILVIAAVLTVSLNADSLAVARALWQQDALRACVAAEATRVAASRGGEALEEDGAGGEGAGAPVAAAACGDPKAWSSFPIGWEVGEGGGGGEGEGGGGGEGEGGGEETSGPWWWSVMVRVCGWLVTIAAVSLGAPFWFDFLGRVANLRSAGKLVERGER